MPLSLRRCVTPRSTLMSSGKTSRALMPNASMMHTVSLTLVIVSLERSIDDTRATHHDHQAAGVAPINVAA